jgi:hypothetical protein
MNCTLQPNQAGNWQRCSDVDELEQPLELTKSERKYIADITEPKLLSAPEMTKHPSTACNLQSERTKELVTLDGAGKNDYTHHHEYPGLDSSSIPGIYRINAQRTARHCSSQRCIGQRSGLLEQSTAGGRSAKDVGQFALVWGLPCSVGW